MRHMIPAVAFAVATLAGAAHAAPLPPPIAAAAASPARGAVTQVDARRKGPELMAFAGVKRGDKVLELIPGSGYFTRLLSLIVGPQGRVYGVWPEPYAKQAVPNVDGLRAMSKQAQWRNIVVLVQPATRLTAPEALDVVFTSQNYHDYPDEFMGRVDPMVFNRAVYRALKPGGVFIVIDHAAQAGSGLRDTDTLHRIDPEAVKKQVGYAGFIYEGETRILRNAKDNKRLAVFDKSVRGNTDQFVFRFRKPRK